MKDIFPPRLQRWITPAGQANGPYPSALFQSIKRGIFFFTRSAVRPPPHKQAHERRPTRQYMTTRQGSPGLLLCRANRAVDPISYPHSCVIRSFLPSFFASFFSRLVGPTAEDYMDLEKIPQLFAKPPARKHFLSCAPEVAF